MKYYLNLLSVSLTAMKSFNICLLISFVFLILNVTILSCQVPELILPIGHSDVIRYACYSPDGKYVFTTSFDKTIKRWDAESGKPVNSYIDGEYGIESIQISSDGKSFITEPAGFGWKEIWDISSALTNETFNKSHIHPIAMSPDGKYVVSVNNDTIAEIRDLLTPKIISTISLAEYNISEAIFSADNQYVFIRGNKNRRSPDSRKMDYYAGLWDLINGNQVYVFKNDSTYIGDAGFSSDSKFLLTFEYEQDNSANQIYKTTIRDIISGEKKFEYQSIPGSLTSISFSRDNKHLIINTNEIRMIFEISNGNLLKAETDSYGSSHGWIFCPDGKHYLKISKTVNWSALNLSYPDTAGILEMLKIQPNPEYLRYTAAICDINSGVVYKTLASDGKKIIYASFSPDGKQIVTAHANNTIKIWETSTGRELKSMEGHSKAIKTDAFASDSRQILSTNIDGITRIWDLSSGKIKNINVGIPGNEIFQSSFSPNKMYFQTIDKECLLKIFETATGKLIKTTGNVCLDDPIIYSPDSRFLLSSSRNHFLLIETSTGLVIRETEEKITASAFTPDSRFLCIAKEDSTASVLETATGTLIRKLQGVRNIIYKVSFSPHGNYLLVNEADDPMVGTSNKKVFDFNSGKLFCTLSNASGYDFQSVFSLDEKYIFGGAEAENKKVWKTATGKVIHEMEESEYSGFPFELSPDGKNVIMPFRMVPALYDIKSFKRIYELDCYESLASSLAFSPDQKHLLASHTDNTAKIWDMQSGKLQHTLKGHTNELISVSYSPDGKFVLTSSLDNKMKLWNAKSGEEIASLISIDSTDWIIVTPDMYYFTSKGALKNMAWKAGNKVLNFEQFDLKYNRPDIVLERIGLADSSLVNMYRNAYFKRLKKMKFEEAMLSPDFNIPEITIIDKEKIAVYSSSRQVTFKAKASDNKYKLNRINIWSNGVPVYGSGGIDLMKLNADSAEVSISVTFSAGINVIEVSCLNDRGVESYKERIEITYEPNEPLNSNLYFFAVSVANYFDKNFNLDYAVKDGRDMTKLFNPATTSLSGIFMDTLFNQDATRENIIALKDKLMKTTVDDIVILYVSGHGLLNSNLDFYFATYDNDFAHPEKRGVSFDELESLLDGIPARKKLLLMDACHSGEVDKEEGIGLIASDTVISSDINFRGSIREYSFKGLENTSKQSVISLNNSFELMKELFAELDKGTGTTVISAAAGKGYALESSQWDNGVFTYTILDGIKNKAADRNGDGHISLSELKDYSIIQVELLTGGRQKPTARRESIIYDWKIW
jgi:WD40 repeat protein